MKPRLGLTLGDPTGIGPEIVAKLLSQGEILNLADWVVIGDQRHLAMGAASAKVELSLPVIDSPAQIQNRSGEVLLDVPTLDPKEVAVGRVSALAGQSVRETRQIAIRLLKEGMIQGLVNAPTNKEATARAGSSSLSDQAAIAHELGFDGPWGELNVLGDLWTSRVTSHVPMAEVSKLLTMPRVLGAIELIQHDLAASGATPKIAVAAYNPHGGEGGLCGTEEIEAIGPAIEAAQAQGIDAQGPFPADTIFPMAKERGFNAIVTMYHDQGQIAMKLLGFHRGVTVSGGLPFPITTTGHGTAHDIAGQGIADPSALEAAMRLAAKMAS